MLHTFGTDINGGLVFERPTVEDGANDTPAPMRPPKGTLILVREASTGMDLSPNSFATDEGGRWTYSTDVEAPSLQIQVSADAGVTWIGPLPSAQSVTNAVTYGETAADAMSIAVDANTKADNTTLRVDDLQTQIENSIAGVAKVVTPLHPDGLIGTVTLNAAEVGARALGVKIAASDINDLQLVATSGSYYDLTDRPAASIPLSAKGTANGVATLDNGGKIPSTQLPPGFGTVGSVNSKTPDANGNVTLTAANVGALPSTYTAPVTSVNSLTGAVVVDWNTLPGKPSTLSDRVLYGTSSYPARPTSTLPIQWDDTAHVAAGNAPVAPPIGGATGAKEGDFWWTIEAA